MSDDESPVDTSGVSEDDYYSLLGIGKKATLEEISGAYRRLSLLFHPDKHHDPLRKKDAELMFNKVKKAYEVLSDDHQRAIYDTLGVKGLETEGWQVIVRTKTADEIRDEYERLVKEKEEQRLNQQTNAKGTMTVTINAAELFESGDEESESAYEKSILRSVEVGSLGIVQSIDMPLTKSSTVTFGGNLTSENGRGAGQFTTSLRHIVSSKTWVEYMLAVGQGPLFTLKGFRTITKKSFATATLYLHFGSRGISPGTEIVLGKQLDTHLVGYLTWKAGIQSSMNTSLVWTPNESQIQCGAQVGLRNSFVNFSYTKKLESGLKLRGSVKFGNNEATIEYGCETKLSQHSVIGATMIVSVPNGVRLKIKVTRANQNFVFPIFLSEEVLPSTIFYGTVVPVLVFFSVKTFVINPYNSREKKLEMEKIRGENAKKLAEKRKAAEATKDLLKETYHRIVAQENGKHGLVVLRSLYGKEADIRSFLVEEDGSNGAAGETPAALEMFDVTVPMQCLIKDSSLSLPPSTKANLPGFYDPSLGEEKVLYVKYRFRDLVHQAFFKDDEELKIPNSGHLGQ